MVKISGLLVKEWPCYCYVEAAADVDNDGYDDDNFSINRPVTP